jgi:hypothetical protein
MNWIYEKQSGAAKKVADELSKPFDDGEMSSGEFFDPWSIFPCFYGSYSADFDWCAIGVLEGLVDADKAVWDLPSHMFREVLCTSDLCDYGSSPRACFATSYFKALLPEFIAKWKGYYENQWKEPYPPEPSTTTSQ